MYIIHEKLSFNWTVERQSAMLNMKSSCFLKCWTSSHVYSRANTLVFHFSFGNRLNCSRYPLLSWAWSCVIGQWRWTVCWGRYLSSTRRPPRTHHSRPLSTLHYLSILWVLQRRRKRNKIQKNSNSNNIAKIFFYSVYIMLQRLLFFLLHAEF